MKDRQGCLLIKDERKQAVVDGLGSVCNVRRDGLVAAEKKVKGGFCSVVFYNKCMAVMWCTSVVQLCGSGGSM